MKTYKVQFRMSTPEEMVEQFKAQLKATPRWKILKRLGLKRNIEFWGRKK